MFLREKEIKITVNGDLEVAALSAAFIVAKRSTRLIFCRGQLLGSYDGSNGDGASGDHD